MVCHPLGERGHRCSAVMCANWFHTKCAAFQRGVTWDKTRELERRGEQGPREGFQLLMPFQFEGTCSREETELEISGE